MPSKAKTINRTLPEDQVAELQRLSGQPQWKDLEQPAKQGTLFDDGGAE